MSPVPNHDWARVISEPTTETIDRSLQAAFKMEKLPPQKTARLYTAVRAAIAAELLKLEHKFKARNGVMDVDNVAYLLAERGGEIERWVPTWCVVTAYDDGSEDEQPFGSLEEALLDIALDDKLTKKLRMR